MRLHIFAVTAGLFISSAAFGDVITGSQVISYTAGTGAVPGYTDPTSALGLPTADTTFGLLTPFNAAFDPSQIVGIGSGGSLVLKLSAPISTGPGATLGIHAAVGLSDYNYPNGQTGDGSDAEPLTYTDPRLSVISVSATGLPGSFVYLFPGPGNTGEPSTFDIPTNYYSQGVSVPSFQFAPDDPSQVANFDQPFTGSLSDFANQDWDGVLSVLGGSAGGNWFNLSGTGLSSVSYIQFTEPSGDVMYVDSVVGLAVPVPEPTTLAIVPAIGGLIMMRRPKRR